MKLIKLFQPITSLLTTDEPSAPGPILDEDLDISLDGADPGDVTAGTTEVTICIEGWKNAGPDERKRMWQMFVETGVFVAVCRHGFLLLLCDMIQSGELYVSPLSPSIPLIFDTCSLVRNTV